MPHFIDLPFDHKPYATSIVNVSYTIDNESFGYISVFGKDGQGSIKVNGSLMSTPYGGIPLKLHLPPGSVVSDITNSGVIISLYRRIM